MSELSLAVEQIKVMFKVRKADDQGQGVMLDATEVTALVAAMRLFLDEAAKRR